ncbi:MAG: type IX secretion system PorP/SprF family membrane protein, partial [Flavobacterium sp.]
MKNKIYLLAIIMLIITKSFGQDPIFTQSLLVPETINPAFTGYLNTYHAGLLHRRQWPNGNRRIDTDFAFLNKDITDHAGLGFTILKHKEEFTNYTYLQFNIDYSYVIEFNNDWFLRLGLESGYGTKNFNFGNLLLEDQININDGSIGNPSNDPILDNAKENINFIDFSAGFLIMKEDLKIG